MLWILVLYVEVTADINKSLSHVDYDCEVVRAAEKFVIEIVSCTKSCCIYIAAIIANFWHDCIK